MVGLGPRLPRHRFSSEMREVVLQLGASLLAPCPLPSHVAIAAIFLATTNKEPILLRLLSNVCRSVWLFRLQNLTNLFIVGAPISTSGLAVVLSQMRRLRPEESSFLAVVISTLFFLLIRCNFCHETGEIEDRCVQEVRTSGCSFMLGFDNLRNQSVAPPQWTMRNKDDRYAMGIGEAEAFSERLKRELLALEAANVHALVECESIIEEVLSWKLMLLGQDKTPYVAKSATLKTEYTKKLAMYNKNQTLSVVLEFWKSFSHVQTLELCEIFIL
ncbi:hypothetical protein ZIOFF_054577 [Zingiber officinale]|uniref:Uncharacterized protein n=1 Tax=Zingiber officinale TaxID=94328 RepID=A0A8J5FKL5_ZINOF|nr:hypothetical protein ZIOFF_054577 [Zingiber officinale]